MCLRICISLVQSERSDGSHSDALYIPRNDVLQDRPPILVEVQQVIDQLFMLRLINYCINVYERFGVLPVVLVFVVDKFSNTTLENHFIAKAGNPYTLETGCQHWAKSVSFVSSKSVNNFIHNDMNPFIALAYFTTSKAQDLDTLAFANNSTVRFLWSICKNGMKKKKQNDIIDVLDKSTQKAKQILDQEDPVLTKNLAKEFLGLIEGEKRKSTEEYVLDVQALEAQQKKYTAKDLQFIESMSVPNKPRKWKEIYDAGKTKGLFNSYTSADSLKSSYYHAMRRSKKQKLLIYLIYLSRFVEKIISPRQ